MPGLGSPTVEGGPAVHGHFQYSPDFRAATLCEKRWARGEIPHMVPSYRGNGFTFGFAWKAKRKVTRELVATDQVEKLFYTICVPPNNCKLEVLV